MVSVMLRPYLSHLAAGSLSKTWVSGIQGHLVSIAMLLVAATGSA